MIYGNIRVGSMWQNPSKNKHYYLLQRLLLYTTTVLQALSHFNIKMYVQMHLRTEATYVCIGIL